LQHERDAIGIVAEVIGLGKVSLDALDLRLEAHAHELP